MPAHTKYNDMSTVMCGIIQIYNRLPLHIAGSPNISNRKQRIFLG